VVLLSHGLWQQRFGGDAGIIGRSLQLDDKVYTIAGVMPATFDFPERMQLWIPAELSYDDWKHMPRSVHFMEVVGEIKTGVSMSRTEIELNAIAEELARKYTTSNEGFGVAPWTLREDTIGDARPALLALLGGVGFVLLVACANVMLSLAGSALGIAFAVAGIDFLAKLVSQTLPHAENIRVNVQVMAFTLAVAALTGVLAGLAPVWQSFKTDQAGAGECGTVGGGRVGRGIYFVAAAFSLAGEGNFWSERY
jgi:putative ABC transport system permease protein